MVSDIANAYSGANALMGGLGGLGGGAFNLGGNMANQLSNRMENTPGLNQSNSGSPCILVSNLDEEVRTKIKCVVAFVTPQ